MYKIYKLTMPNGKVYIGQTKLSLKQRWQRGQGYKYQQELYEDILAFGWENVEHELLEEVEEKELAYEKERYYILEYKSYLPEFGYNKHTNLYRVCDSTTYWRNADRKCRNVKNPHTQIRCVETGELFENMKEAGLSVGKSVSGIQKAIQHGYRCGGYHWEKAEPKATLF